MLLSLVQRRMGPFSDVVFHENTFSKSKIRSKGADLFWHPQFYSSIAPMTGIKQKVIG